jgi:hydroxyacylglutathione hydrolase
VFPAPKTHLLFLMLAACALAAEPQPTALEPGTLPGSWVTGGPDCVSVPDWQVHPYNKDFYILRESGCTHFEKPFLYLIFGRDQALLEDTGAGDVKIAPVVQDLLAKWARRENRAPIPLVVVHSHGHGDHVAGDAQLAALPNVQVISASVPEMQKAFGIAHWPEETGSIDLGDRVLDVIPIPGHQAASIALYDRRTGILLTGDTLYPGRLYVSDFSAFAASAQRLVDFTRNHPVSHVLGTHIEQSGTPFVDYPRGTSYQPDEHELALSRAHLFELNDVLQRMNGKLQKAVLSDFTIVPPPQRRPN